MPSPFPGMDPFLEKKPIFHDLHTQMLADIQAQLQPQLRPKYVARLERHLSEGSVWDMEEGLGVELDGEGVSVTAGSADPEEADSTATLATPTASLTEELDPDELELRKQRRIVIYVRRTPRLAVASIELLTLMNKEAGSTAQTRYLEKRGSALHGGLHWIEIDLVRGGERTPIPVTLPRSLDYLCYVAQATPGGWKHLVYGWGLRDPLPRLPIPLLGADQATLGLATCFRSAYDRAAADDEADYSEPPPPPPLRSDDQTWVDELLREHGLRS